MRKKFLHVVVTSIFFNSRRISVPLSCPIIISDILYKFASVSNGSPPRCNVIFEENAFGNHFQIPVDKIWSVKNTYHSHRKDHLLDLHFHLGAVHRPKNKSPDLAKMSLFYVNISDVKMLPHAKVVI